LAYNNPPAGSPWVIDAFFLPDLLALLFLAFFGLLSLEARWPSKKNWLRFAVLACLLWVSPTQFRADDYSKDFLSFDYAHDLQELLPTKAVLLAAGGFDAFGFWYLQGVEQRRPDLTLVDVPLLSDWYLEQLSPRIPELQAAWNSKEELLDALLGSRMLEPLYYTSHNPGDRGIPLGLVSYAPAPGAPVALNLSMLSAPWPTLRLRYLDEVCPKDPNRSELMGYYPASADALGSFANRVHNAALANIAQQWRLWLSPKS
jgi:hypothetical protein